MLDHLIFDTTDTTTMADTHSVGAYVRSGKSGALVTNHSLQKPNAVIFTLIDADVTPGTDSIAVAAHGLQTGDKIQLTTTGVLPAGLALSTDYYVIRVSSGVFKLAISAYNAESNIPVDITAAAGGGTHTVTGFEVEGRSLDVWVSNTVAVSGTVELGASSLAALETITVLQGTSPWVVSATNLDIRDLAFATDKVDVSGSTVELGATTLAALETITVLQGTSPWVVSGTVTVTDASNYAEDSVHASGDIGKFVLAVRNDANTALAADGDYTPFTTDAQGRLKVAAEVTVQAGDAEFLEDSAHVSADAGIHMLAVRQDTLTSSVSADGDYASFKVNALGRLYVEANDATVASTAIAAAVNTLGTANVAEDVVASPLANRKYLWIYNNDNQRMYIGQSGVTAGNGFPIAPGSYMELKIGAAVDVEWVSAKTNHDMRSLEIS